jgi:hypothetical protein
MSIYSNWPFLRGIVIIIVFFTSINSSRGQVVPQFNTPQLSIEAIYLSWQAFPASQSYELYWSTSSGVDLSSTSILLSPSSILSYWHTGLTGGSTYYYRIRSLDQFNNWTLLSNELEVTVPITPTEWYGGGSGDGHSSTFLCYSLLNGNLGTPTFSNVFVYRSAELNRITWLQHSGATDYLLEESITSDGPWTTLNNTPNLFFEHTNLIGNSQFFYRVTPLGGSGCAVNPSNAVEAIAIPNNNVHPGGNADGHANILLCSSTLNGVFDPPSTPNFVVYEGIQETFIFWSLVPGAASYNIEFSTTSAAGPWTPLVSNHASTNYIHTELVAGQTYYYRLRANSSSACGFDWSNTFSGVPRPLIETSGVSLGGGVGDGHAALRTCPLFLDGTFDSPNSQAISVYMSTEFNYIAWPQQSGATDYSVQVATNAGGPWSLLTSTASLATSHAPPSMVTGTQYFYRVTANISTGCLLNPSTPVSAYAAPTYSNTNCAGGLGDGHASLRTCPLFLDGVLNSPNSQPITVYSSVEQNLIAWPQESGSSNYTLEFATATTGPWSLLSNTSLFSFAHQPSSLVAGTAYFYRVRANLTDGCPLNPSLAVSGIGVPQYNLYGGGNADGHAYSLLCSQTLNGLPTPPSTPDFVVYEGIQELFIFWSSVAGAASYNLEFSTTSATGPWISLSTNFTGINFTHTGLLAGQTYFYRLLANSSGECSNEWSNSFNGIPRPLIEATGVGVGGGIGDGHANARSCTFVTLDQSSVYILGATTFCHGDSVSLKASQAVLYTWYQDGVPIPGGTLDSLSVTESGTYKVETFNIFSCVAASLEIDVIVHPLPPDPPMPIPSPSGISCGPVELFAIGDPSPNQYFWQGTEPNSLDMSLPGFEPYIASNSGTYYLRSISSENCWSDGLSEVTVYVMPEPTLITPSTNSNYCEIGSANAWNYFVDLDGKAIAAIQNDGNALGGVTTTTYVTGELSNRFDGNNEFLGRHFIFNTEQQPLSPVKVRLYFSQEELDILITSSQSSPSPFDNISSIFELVVTKYQGPTEDGLYNMNDATDIQVIIPDFFDSNLDGYFVEFTTSSFSEFWIHGFNLVPLPIELLFFNATCNKESIFFNWSTASETNNHFFQIQASENLIVWENIGIVNGNGNTNQVIEYNFLWSIVQPQFKYFRLKQQDFNGDVSFSDVIFKDCNISPSNEFEIIYVYNENGETTIFVQHPSRSDGIFEIFDASGRLIEQSIHMLSKGKSSIQLNSKSWARGIYFIKLTTNEGVRSYRFAN